MSRKTFFVSAFLMGVLMLDHFGGASPANAAIAGKSLLNSAIKTNEAANTGVIEVKRRYRRGYRRHWRGYRHSYWPRRYYRRHYRRRYYDGPFLGFYLGPYYYDRYYYDPYPYYGYRYRRHSSRCAYWSRRCARNWGYGNNDYYGCLRYHRCR